MGTPTARESAFHVGERSVQERAGEVQQAARVAGVIHGSIPAAALSFLRERAFIVVAAADEKGAVWCTQLGSQPGFMYAVDEFSLRVEALPLPDDPLFPVLQNACATPQRHEPSHRNRYRDHDHSSVCKLPEVHRRAVDRVSRRVDFGEKRA